MNSIKDIIRGNNVNNDNKLINDNNVIPLKVKNYALDRNKFTPNTEEAQLAEEYASFFNDFQNYAFYYSVVNKKGISRAKEILADIKDEIKEKGNTKYQIRNPKRYFAWKYKKGLYT